MRKKFLALGLAISLLLGALALPASAAGFPDVTDPQVSEAVEILRLLGVVNGAPDGTFKPQGTFTRAEFCKMAIVILGRQEEARLQSGRVIFQDVTARHWALGYINAAAAVPSGDTGALPLVQGKSNGLFEPNSPITYGEAVTILMRALGYSDQEVRAPGKWYAGHLLRAKAIGLLDGLDLGGEDVLTRGQAALLFENLLFTQPKGSDQIFLSDVLGGSVTDSLLILEVNAKSQSSGKTILRTSEGNYTSLREELDAASKGKQAKLVLNGEGDVLALRLDGDYTTRTVRVLSAEARYLVTDAQEQILVNASTPVWQAGQGEGTYGELYAKSIPYGTGVVLCYDKTDTLVSLFILGDSGSVTTAVAQAGSDPFPSIPTAGRYTVYRNGVLSSLSAVKPYDVGVYDGHAGTLNVYDRKLTGVYENAFPSPVSPSSITLMGAEFPVLECALKDLAGYQLGDPMTLLLDGQNRVAGVVSPDVASARALGVATITPGANGSFTAQVTLTTGVTLSGSVSSNQRDFRTAPGKLVAVSSTEARALRLSQVTTQTVPGAWDVAAGKIGSLRLSPDAVVYDQVGDGALRQIELSDVTIPTVPAGKIRFLHQDSSGNVDVLILNDVTGDNYTYGILAYTPGVNDPENEIYTNAGVSAANSAHSVSLVTSMDLSKQAGSYVGLAPSLSYVDKDGGYRLGAQVTLKSLPGVRRTAFGTDSVTVNGVTYSLAADIDACCYNASSKTWFASLDAALAYTDHLTLYYDRAPSQGGKIRLVVAD